jgi:hypothetical protein
VPNANLSAADYKATNSDGSNAKNLQTTAGTGGAFSANVTLTTIANATSKRGMVAQHASMPLSAQTIAAGNWTVGFVGRYQYFASATKVWKGWAALYLVNGLTGAIRTTIFAVSDIGSTGRTGIAALTCYAASVAGASAVVTAGDYLVLEWGVTATNNSGATASNQIVSGAYGSVTAITSDAATNFSPRSFITAPSAITYPLSVTATPATLGLTYTPNAATVQAGASPSVFCQTLDHALQAATAQGGASPSVASVSETYGPLTADATQIITDVEAPVGTLSLALSPQAAAASGGAVGPGSLLGETYGALSPSVATGASPALSALALALSPQSAQGIGGSAVSLGSLSLLHSPQSAQGIAGAVGIASLLSLAYGPLSPGATGGAAGIASLLPLEYAPQPAAAIQVITDVEAPVGTLSLALSPQAAAASGGAVGPGSGSGDVLHDVQSEARRQIPHQALHQRRLRVAWRRRTDGSLREATGHSQRRDDPGSNVYAQR